MALARAFVFSPRKLPASGLGRKLCKKANCIQLTATKDDRGCLCVVTHSLASAACRFQTSSGPNATRSKQCHRRFCSAGKKPSIASETSSEQRATSNAANHTTTDCSLAKDFLEGTKLTSIAHQFWTPVISPGDTVIDATMGNGHDTLMLARLALTQGQIESLPSQQAPLPRQQKQFLSPEGGCTGQNEETSSSAPSSSNGGSLHDEVGGSAALGRVFAFDVQSSALTSTKKLLEATLSQKQLDRVVLLNYCHSTMAAVAAPESVKLVSFNLGYLPGAVDKGQITRAASTVKALEAAVHLLKPGGLISVVAYIGHEGGMEEFVAVCDVAKNLDPKKFVCSQHAWLNRAQSPILIVMYRRNPPT